MLTELGPLSIHNLPVSVRQLNKNCCSSLLLLLLPYESIKSGDNKEKEMRGAKKGVVLIRIVQSDYLN